ncbi:hypothetical protein ACF3OF_02030 [Sneathia vaginalis]|jgi:hypothetical protein|uniref:hypothetical protein n=1 Tax=Sneathia vaginalis TaxID=187101 RepID=UPI002592DAA8|nr:hypothetical protein [uncultured Sneathia sp.]
MINIDICSVFNYYDNNTENIDSLNLEFIRLNKETLYCENEKLYLILEENKITIKKDDKLSYTKVFDLDNYTTAFLKLDNMVMNTKIKTIFLRNTNNHININAKEYSINDEFLSEININIYFKGEN